MSDVCTTAAVLNHSDSRLAILHLLTGCHCSPPIQEIRYRKNVKQQQKKTSILADFVVFKGFFVFIPPTPPKNITWLVVSGEFINKLETWIVVSKVNFAQYCNICYH